VAALRSGPTTPPEVVLVDAQGTRVVATSGAEAWDRVVLADPEPIVVRHRDVVLHARLHRASAPSGRLLCWIHGGPTDQWPADFRPRLAYWRTRGWDVVTVDPRGSTGHGRRYQQALNGGWGQLDVDDAATVLADMHHRHGTAPASTVVIGGSSGGLTALGILLDHPELVAGGVASYPVSDLAALADATHRFEAHYTDTLIGPPDLAATAQAMHDRSPVHRADRLRRPLLLFHGDLDPVVPRAHSDLLVDRILASGGDVEYVVYEGEGHGFRDPANVRDEYARTEAFLGRVVN
jgi:dipeptidyl aminopeptidase/acylaminoacyl peptidase